MSFTPKTMLLLSLLSPPAWGGGNIKIKHFSQAKRLAREIHQEHPYTIYCHCRYEGQTINLKSCGYQSPHHSKRAQKLEWEHVVPAEAFGQSFPDWKEGSPFCIRKSKKYKGRACAKNNPAFSYIESDLYNIWPEIGELNGLRSNYSMAELSTQKLSPFGKCKVKIENRKFEPMPLAKGRIARTYLYMNQAYPSKGPTNNPDNKPSAKI